MRVLVDTNIIISAMVFKSSAMGALLRKIRDEHELCIASYTIDETKRILNEKFGNIGADVEVFFKDYPYTIIQSPVTIDKPLVRIRDDKDYPVIHTAITAQIDVIITGDKDFFGIKVDRPEIMTPSDFVAKY